MVKTEIERLSKKFESYRKQKNSGNRIYYSPKLKKSAVRLVENGIELSQAAKSLGISTSAIRSWRKIYNSTSSIKKEDILPLVAEPNKELVALGQVYKPEEVNIQITRVDITISHSQIATTLHDIMVGLGGSK